MGLDWVDKIDGIDDVLADDINSIAHEVISQGQEIYSLGDYDETLREEIQLLDTNKADKSEVEVELSVLNGEIEKKTNIDDVNLWLNSKADKNLSNIDDSVFKQKAEQAGVGGSIVDLSNYYNRQEIDSKLSSVYTFMGSVYTSELDMPDYFFANTNEKYVLDSYDKYKNGYVYNIKDSGTIKVGLTPSKIIDKTDSLRFYWSNHVEDDVVYGYFLLENEKYVIDMDSITFFHSLLNEELLITVERQPNGDFLVTEVQEFIAGSPVGTINSLPSGTYNISAIELPDIEVIEGDNIAWTNRGWDKLAGTIDLSNYPTKEDLENTLGDIETLLGGI